jgi:hypothetical protein
MGIKLGVTPADVKFSVTFAMPDGADGVIEATAAALTRKELAKRVDELRVKADGLKAETSLAVAVQQSDEAVADFLAGVLKSWDVEAELTMETLTQLVNELPAAGTALVEGYQKAVFEGVQKN